MKNQLILLKTGLQVKYLPGFNPGPLTLQGTNTFLLGNGKNKILIDTSDGNQQFQTNIDHTLLNSNSNISKCFISHRHKDHFAGTKKLYESQNNCQFYKRKTSQPDPNNGIQFQHVEDLQQFEIENDQLQVLYTPGHTDDHLCFYLKKNKALFSTDAILGNQSSVTIEYLKEYMESLEKLQKLEIDVMFTGKGSFYFGSDSCHEMIQNQIEHRLKREKQILECLNITKGSSIDDILSIVYKGIEANLHEGAKLNIQTHLQKLQIENRVKKVDSNYILVI